MLFKPEIHMPPPNTIQQRVHRFEDNLASFRSNAYNETTARRVP